MTTMTGRWWPDSIHDGCCDSDLTHRQHLAALYTAYGACDQCGHPQTGVLDVERDEVSYCAPCGTYWVLYGNAVITANNEGILAGPEPAFGTAAEWATNRTRLATMRRVEDPWAKVPAWAWALRDRMR